MGDRPIRLDIPLFLASRWFLVQAACLAGVLLTGCFGGSADDGPTLAPVFSLVPPGPAAPGELPELDVLRQRLSRRTKVGLGGEIEVTLLTPTLVYVLLSERDGSAPRDEADESRILGSRWQAFFGRSDRLPFDIAWRFDQQFQASARILDPTTWEFVLKNDRGSVVTPSAVSVLSASRLPVNGFWQGQVRVWFPFRDPVQHQSILGGDIQWARLILKHRSGDGTLLWRLHSPF